MIWLYVFLGMLVVLIIGLLAWMFFVEPKRFEVWEVEVSCSAGAGSEDGRVKRGALPEMRILHITDTHFRGDESSKLRFLSGIDTTQYDFAFLTGDLIEDETGLAACEKMIAGLKPKYGIYGVLGGHDYFRGTSLFAKYISLPLGESTRRFRQRTNPVSELKRILTKHAVCLLEDESRRVTFKDGTGLNLIGLQDTFVFDCDFDKAWDGISRDEPIVVIAHSPNVLPEVAKRGADVAFFGHTHGGQVRFPLVGAIVTRSTLKTIHARGVHRRGDTVYIINNGLGTGRFSGFRLLCRPQVGSVRLGARS